MNKAKEMFDEEILRLAREYVRSRQKIEEEHLSMDSQNTQNFAIEKLLDEIKTKLCAIAKIYREENIELIARSKRNLLKKEELLELGKEAARRSQKIEDDWRKYHPLCGRGEGDWKQKKALDLEMQIRYEAILEKYRDKE